MDSSIPSVIGVRVTNRNNGYQKPTTTGANAGRGVKKIEKRTKVTRQMCLDNKSLFIYFSASMIWQVKELKIKQEGNYNIWETTGHSSKIDFIPTKNELEPLDHHIMEHRWVQNENKFIMFSTTYIGKTGIRISEFSSIETLIMNLNSQDNGYRKSLNYLQTELYSNILKRDLLERSIIENKEFISLYCNDGFKIGQLKMDIENLEISIKNTIYTIETNIDGAVITNNSEFVFLQSMREEYEKRYLNELNILKSKQKELMDLEYKRDIFLNMVIDNTYNSISYIQLDQKIINGRIEIDKLNRMKPSFLNEMQLNRYDFSVARQPRPEIIRNIILFRNETLINGHGHE